MALNPEQFAQTIGEAIAKGFAEARQLLGTLPEQTEAELAQTDQLVKDGLDAFVRTGQRPDDAARLGRIETFRASLSDEVQVQSQRRAAYNGQGQAVDQARAGTFGVTG